MTKKFGDFLTFLCCIGAMIGCTPLSDRVTNAILDCGPEYTELMPGEQTIPVSGLKTQENSFAAFVTEKGEQLPLRMSSKACVVLPARSDLKGWVVVKSSAQSERIAVERIETLRTSQLLEFNTMISGSAPVDCPKTPGQTELYLDGKGEVVLEQGSLSNSRRFYQRLSSAGRLLPEHGTLNTDLKLDTRGLSAGAYQFEFMVYNLAAIPSPIQVLHRQCPVRIDTQAPTTQRKNFLGNRALAPGSLVEVLASEDSPYLVKLCWIARSSNQDCTLETQQQHFTRAPMDGDWLLSYQFEDAAGNVSERFSEYYSIVDDNAIDSVRTARASFENHMDQADTLAALLSLTEAVKKKAKLGSSAEREQFPRSFLDEFTRLALTGVAKNRINLSPLDSLFLTTDGYVTSRFNRGMQELSRYDFDGEKNGTLSLKTGIPGFSIYNPNLYEFIASDAIEGFTFYDQYFREKNRINLPKTDQLCNQAHFSSEFSRIILRCEDQTLSEVSHYIFDRNKPASAWTKISPGLDKSLGSEIELVSDGSLLVIYQAKELKSFVYLSDEPLVPVDSFSGNALENASFWKKRLCKLDQSTLLCSDYTANGMPPLRIEGVRRMSTGSLEGFLLLSFEDGHSEILNLDTFQSERKELSLPLQLLQPDPSSMTLLGVLDSGTIAAFPPMLADRYKPVYTMRNRGGNTKTIKPEALGISKSCKMAFFRYRDQLIVSSSDNGVLLPYKAFKVPEPISAQCIESSRGKELVVQSRRQQYFFFTVERDFADSTSWNPSNLSTFDSIPMRYGRQLTGVMSTGLPVWRDLGAGLSSVFAKNSLSMFPECGTKTCQLLLHRKVGTIAAAIAEDTVFISIDGFTSTAHKIGTKVIGATFLDADTLLVSTIDGWLVTVQNSSQHIDFKNRELGRKIYQLQMLANGDIAALSTTGLQTQLVVLDRKSFRPVLTKTENDLGLRADEIMIRLHADLNQQDFFVSTLNGRVFKVDERYSISELYQLPNLILIQRQKEIGNLELIGDKQLVSFNPQDKAMESGWNNSFDQAGQLPTLSYLLSSNEDKLFGIGRGSELTLDSPQMRIDALAITDDTLYVAGARELLSLPLNEAALAIRACQYLAAFIKHNQPQSPYARKICSE